MKDKFKSLPIDTLLYPCSAPGIIMLSLFVVASTILLFLNDLFGRFSMALRPIGFFIGVSYFWYLCECIRNSAQGSVRAPSLLGNSDDLHTMIEQYCYIAICWVIFLLPSILYAQFAKIDYIFYFLLAYGILTFPMAILRVIMFDSLTALNPIGLLWSIIKTFPFYLGLLIIICLVTTPFIFIIFKMDNHALAGFFAIFFLSCITMLFAHLLGRFYYKHQNILKWNV